tara:strand:+ start:1509 stop:2438 length:930 start_codon:yes stop_codon:yes gene_type:complete
MTTRKDIIDEARRELQLVENNLKNFSERNTAIVEVLDNYDEDIKQIVVAAQSEVDVTGWPSEFDRESEKLPPIQKPIQDNIDDLLVPAAEFDKRVCELTIPVNAKIRELQVLTGLIGSGGVDACGTVDGDGNAVGPNVSFDVVRGARNDSESISHVGMNPYSTTIFGANTEMTTGTNPTTIITANLGVGVDTNIGSTGTFLAQESDSTDGDGDPCEISTGDAYDSVYPGFVNTTYAARRTALLAEIASLRTIRNNFMNTTANELKKELKFKYTQRYSLYVGWDKLKTRKSELESQIAMATDPAYKDYYS